MSAKEVSTIIVGTVAILACLAQAHSADEGSAAKKDGAHKLVKVYLGSGNPGTSIADGPNLVGTLEVACPKSEATCTLALSAMDEVCGGGIGTTFQIIVMVDGTQVDGGNWVANWGNTGNYCGGGDWSDVYGTTSGTHNVQLYTDWSAGTGGVTQGQWSANYAVTVP